MDIKNFLEIVKEQIKYEPVKNNIGEELKSHIEDAKEDFINKGMEKHEAEEKAVKAMGNPEEIGKKLNKVHRQKLDWKLLILIFILIGFGIINSVLKNDSVSSDILVKTFTYIAVGAILCIGMYFVDYRRIKKYSIKIYIASTIIMILPYIGMSKMINGVAYLSIFNVTVSQAIICVPLYLIAFIGMITNYDVNKNIEIKFNNKEFKINTDSIKIAALSVFSIILMLMIPSMANGAILCFAYLVSAIFEIAKYSKEKTKKIVKILAPFCMLVLILIGFLANSPYRLYRIKYSFHPEEAPNGYGYVGTIQNKVLKNAKWFGEVDSEDINLEDLIISKESQYTFIYFVGKMGIVVSSILVFIILLISAKLILDAKNIKDQYGKLLVIGMGTLYIVQSIASVLINVNCMLQVSVNLPFVSYGGTYFIINAIEIGLILSVYKRKDVIEYEEVME